MQRSLHRRAASMRGPAPTHASAWLTMRRRGLGRRPDGCEPAGRGDAAGPCCRAGEVSGEASYSGLPLRGVVYRSPGSALDEARPEMPLTVPLLPFTPDEVLLPGGVKTLHLYEARYLSMLEEVLESPHKCFGHVVIEQPEQPASSEVAKAPMAYVGDNFVMHMATLVKVLEVKAISVGALVRVQAEGRVGVAALTQIQPFIRGTVIPLRDDAVEDAAVVKTTATELQEVMKEALNLSMKFSGLETATLQRAMLWCNSSAVPLVYGLQQVDAELEAAARLSFAALQALPKASGEEKRRLLSARKVAMGSLSTVERLDTALGVMAELRSMLRAKCALKALDIGV